jgi:hypothetical protein
MDKLLSVIKGEQPSTGFLQEVAQLKQDLEKYGQMTGKDPKKVL